MKCRVCQLEIPTEEQILCVANRYGKKYPRVFRICKPCSAEYQRARRKRNAEKIKEQQALYRSRPGAKEKARALAKQWRLLNPDRCRSLKNQWRRQNPEINRCSRRRYIERARLDPARAIRLRLRARVYAAIKACGSRKSESTEALIGCSINQAIKHIESTFCDGMSWSNKNLWHIDHIIPLCSFNLLDPAEQKKAFHYTNIQAMWIADHRKKHGRST